MAAHMVCAIDYFASSRPVTSTFLAGSIGTSPVMVRTIMGMLKQAGIIKSSKGKTGITLARPLEKITLLDLWRAVETCTIIAEPHGQQVVTTPLLRERDWGGFTGKFIPSLKGRPWPDDVETLDHMKQRAQAFMAWLRDTYPGKTVLAVGHGIMNKAIQSVYYDKPMNEIEKMANAEVRKLTL